MLGKHSAKFSLVSPCFLLPTLWLNAEKTGRLKVALDVILGGFKPSPRKEVLARQIAFKFSCQFGFPHFFFTVCPLRVGAADPGRVKAEPSGQRSRAPTVHPPCRLVFKSMACCVRPWETRNREGSSRRPRNEEEN